MSENALPPQLAEIRDEFLELDEPERLQLLLEYSGSLPALPSAFESHPDRFERVAECQSPVFIALEVSPEGIVSMHATAPAEAPTTRGFASILVQGLSGLTADEVLAVPADFAQSIGLTRAVSPLRIAGMTGMLLRAQRQIKEKLPS